ncbi:MAG: c-type cytochrome biogenesis protein CcmF [Candidatus Dactylopiibacterium carminicum]|nr:MAG: c-type cytochrome biogenesis protein CcmF [Candidatus Dactylopiibacterium carminicum]
MIPEFGHFALILAALVALVQGVLPLWGAQRGQPALMAVAAPAARAQFALVLLAFLCLTWAFVANDFSVAYVVSHSNTQLPLICRITAVWGSHEGSLLLWLLMQAGWAAAVSLSRRLPGVFAARVLGVLGLVSVGFIAFTLVSSNPFERLLPGVPEGQDLNPLLQDPGMIIHPPLLYMGYVGFSVAFAFAIAALIGGQFDAAWARISRPWTLAAWVFLTLGIALGSGWAYYELGWGGWWFWDPVENASFMPWLVGTALIHSLAVTEKRGAFKRWTVLLAIAAFSLSLLGTFLVRSGVLTSVHAFATDPSRGVFILVLLLLVIGGSLALYAWRAPRLEGGGSFQPFSRDALLLSNNVLLVVVATSVLLGTMYPLLVDALGGGKLSVGPPYFDAVFFPLMTPVVALMVLAPFVRWKGQALPPLLRRLAPALGLSLLLGAGIAWASGAPGWRTVLGLTLAAWVLLGSVQLLVERLRGEGGAMARLRGIPGAWWGMWLAHLGVGVFIIGVSMVRTHESQLDVAVQIGGQARLAGYEFTLEEVNELRGPNYMAAQAWVRVTRNGRDVARLHPEKRLYLARQMPMTEAAIDVGPFRDVYVSLGEATTADTWVLRLYHKPFISWIWAGCALMALGGLSAALDARYRDARRQRSPRA